MSWEAWFSIGVVAMVFAMLAFSRVAPDIILIGAVAILLLSGILAPDEALSGLSNEGMVTVGVLFIVGAGVRETGGVQWIAQILFGRPKTANTALVRMMLPTMGLSAFMNNTPLVAMLIPAVEDWAKQCRIAVSKLMIPLSYAAILGGTCTLIGTSTNLVVNGMLIKQAKIEIEQQGATKLPMGMGLFDITPIAVPCAIAGFLFILLTARWMLPDRRSSMAQLDDPREYTVEMLVAADSSLVGKTIEQAGLRHLPGAFVAEIERDGTILPAVSPQERLRANDRLLFVGIVESVVDLQKIRGLVPATNQVFKLSTARPNRCLVEAVVSNTSPLVGRSIRDGRFRSVYNAVVIAVSRNGERVRQKIGDIVVRAGDTLLVESHPSFVEQQRNSRDFFLVSRLQGSTPPRHDRAVLALAIMLVMVTVVTAGLLTMLTASMLAAGAMLVTRCCTGSGARRAVDWQVLMAIAASFALGDALQKTGAVAAIADTIIELAGGNPWLALVAIYGVTMVATELITNNAAAALMFPFALATAEKLGVSVMPFAIVIMMAASAVFSSPIGYQTNLMVFGPGGYRFSDYMRIGVPLNLTMWFVTVALTPLVWKF